MIFLFSALFVTVHAQFFCEVSSGSYKTSDEVTLCVFLSQVDFTNATSLITPGPYLAFKSKLDEYSAVRLSNSYLSIVTSECPGVDVNSTAYTNCSMSYAITVASDNLVQSTSVPYLKDYLVATVFSIVVTLDNGKVTKIEWDNYCDMCNDQCMSWGIEEVCADKECAVETEGDCDPRVYISWIGTDKDGNNLLSASYRMSQFRKYSVYQMYSDAKGKF